MVGVEHAVFGLLVGSIGFPGASLYPLTHHLYNRIRLCRSWSITSYDSLRDSLLVELLRMTTACLTSFLVIPCSIRQPGDFLIIRMKSTSASAVHSFSCL